MSDTIAMPGTPGGPCVECDHPRCRDERFAATRPCRFCGIQTGYDVDLYTDPLGSDRHREFVHAACLDARVGPREVLANSSFRYESAPNITHATTPDGAHTLCGRDCSVWLVSQEASPHGPGCRSCERAWRKLIT